MPLLLGLVFALIVTSFPLFSIFMYATRGISGLLSLTLVSWNILAGSMWFLGQQKAGLDNSYEYGMFNYEAMLVELIEALPWPWGTLWIINTLLIAVYIYFLCRHSGQKTIKP